MRFEWVAVKNLSNQKKHLGNDFEAASRVFANPILTFRKDHVADGEQGNQMAKKSSASSPRGRQIRVSAESIWNKPLTDRQKAALDRVAKKQKRADVSDLKRVRLLWNDG
jgi:uncharacterized DUF497 family protein